LELAFLKSIKGASALRLAAIAVDHRCCKPLAYQGRLLDRVTELGFLVPARPRGSGIRGALCLGPQKGNLTLGRFRGRTIRRL
jgi:hypothetical protein